MRCPSTFVDEEGRLRALSEYGLSESQELPALQPIVQLAAQTFQMPIAAVNMIGDERVFFAASHGIGECDMRRDVSFCAHAILQNDVMVIPDAALDVRFHDNPLVTAELGIRFYAGVPLKSPSGHPLGALCVIDHEPRNNFTAADAENLRNLASLVSDKLELRRLEAAREMWPFRFQEIATTSPGPLLGFDKTLRVTFCNAAAAALFGFAIEEITGKPFAELLPQMASGRLAEVATLLISSGHMALNAAAHETVAIHREGAVVPVELVFFTWKQMGVLHFGAMLTDITERRKQELELFRLSNFDVLTGLANRAVLRQEVAEQLRYGGEIAVLALDFDNFKDINGTLGQSMGDEVLCIAANRMQRCIRADDMLARTGGDEFGVLLHHADLSHARTVALSLIQKVGKPINVDEHRVRVIASCGIAIPSAEKEGADELLGNADFALHQAKELGSGNSAVYTPALRKEAEERRRYGAELHLAVENEEFELFYQPQIRLTDLKLVGAEALIRWKHPQRGYLAPAVFLPVLETESLAGAVGQWVLKVACAQAAEWRKAGASELRMGVNLFAAQFLTGDLAHNVEQVLEKCEIPPDALELEITENIILHRDTLILDTLKHLRQQGVGIAFDDFGTGYASLSLLKDYPLTRIKIDKTFTMGMCGSSRDEATVAATVGLARNYDLEVIAEGVETEEHLVRLSKLGCDEAQGFYFARPLPATEFAAQFLVH